MTKTSPSACVFSALLAGCGACAGGGGEQGTPQQGDRQDATVPETAVTGTSNRKVKPDMIDPSIFSQTFPPRWKLGDTWSISATTEDVLRSRPDRPVDKTKEFLFKFVGSPDGDAELARVVVTDLSLWRDDETYELTFRMKPFSLAAYRVMDLKTGAIRYTAAENGPNPFLGPRSSGLIVDFPVHPPEHALAGPLPFTFELDRHGVQTVEVTPEGLRFVVAVGTERCTFEWKRGEPWWSTFRRVLFLEEAGEFEVDSAHLVREPAGR